MTGPGPGPALRTVALIKQVPLGEHDGLLDGDGRLRRDGLDTEMNPWCRRAVTHAVQLGAGGHSTVVTMGPPGAADVLREALTCGADDALHVSDRVLAGSDCLITARVLAAAVRSLGYVDLVVVGRSSVDGSTGAVGAMVAELLGLPFAGPVLDLRAERPGRVPRLLTTLQLDGASEVAAVTLPAVVSVAERSCAPAKAPSHTWPNGEGIRQVTAAELGVLPGPETTSPTRVAGARRAAATRRPEILDSGPPADGTWKTLDTSPGREGRSQKLDSGPPADGTWKKDGGIAGRVSRVADVLLAPAEQGGNDHADDGRRTGHTPTGTGPDVLAVTEWLGGSGARALLASASAAAEAVGGRVLAVSPDARAAELTTADADEAILLGAAEPRPVAAALISWIRGRRAPWAVLGGSTSWEREVLARLGAGLGAGLMSDLVSVAVTESHGRPRLAGTKPSGDGLLAEIVSDVEPQIATLRTGSIDLPESGRTGQPIPTYPLRVGIEPQIVRSRREVDHDHDALERADIVIGVGQGIDPHDYAELEALRELLGAEFAATRKVTDAGWLPHSRQVGITARTIAPRCYVAIGISGNPNHLAAVRRAGTVVAINNDPAAAIFGQCDIGIVADWRDTIPLLTAEVARRRSRAVRELQSAALRSRPLA